MESSTLVVSKASQLFKKGAYKEALEQYEKAGQLIGPQYVLANIQLCRKRIEQPQKKRGGSTRELLENMKVKKMNEQIADLKRQLRQKDANINERFEELALLTRMLEEKDNAVSA